MGSLTQKRLLPFSWVMGADNEKIFAFGGNVLNQTRNNAHPAGNLFINSAVVPSGEVWVIQNISIIDVTTAIPAMIIQATSGANTIALKYQATPAATVWYTWQGQIELIAGDYINGFFQGTLLNDDCYLVIAGYKMVVP